MKEIRKKTAIIYDWIDKWGGVERILLTLHEMYPHAVFYTSYTDFKTAKWADKLEIKTSYIQKLPAFIKKNRLFSFLFYPFAFETFDFSSYETVISVTSSFAKSVVTKPETKHICLLLTPTRYLWLYPHHYIPTLFFGMVFRLLNRFKSWDKTVSKRPDLIISISNEVKRRCWKYYRVDSPVIYPPFDIGYWEKVKSQTPVNFSGTIPDDYFLVVSRLEPYKKVDSVIDVFNRLKHKKLIVVGKGSLTRELINRSKSDNISFFKDISDSELGWLYTHANALIVPQEEDFGYTALEAQFFGCPVIAYGKGGLLETVIEGKTGLFFTTQSATAIAGALERYDKISYNLKRSTEIFGKRQVRKFSKTDFVQKWDKIVTNSVPKSRITGTG